MARSRTNGESLPETLAPWQIGYEHIAEIGGLPGKARSAEYRDRSRRESAAGIM
jgi:hypothetical protein